MWFGAVCATGCPSCSPFGSSSDSSDHAIDSVHRRDSRDIQRNLAALFGPSGIELRHGAEIKGHRLKLPRH